MASGGGPNFSSMVMVMVGNFFLNWKLISKVQFAKVPFKSSVITCKDKLLYGWIFSFFPFGQNSKKQPELKSFFCVLKSVNALKHLNCLRTLELCDRLSDILVQFSNTIGS